MDYSDIIDLPRESPSKKNPKKNPKKRTKNSLGGNPLSLGGIFTFQVTRQVIKQPVDPVCLGVDFQE